MSKLYFTALRSLERLEIQYVPPEIAITRSPIIAGVAVVGRNNPKHHYLGGSTEMSLELDFHSEEASREDVITKCKWLESLAYGDAFDNPPETVRLTFGKLFRNNEIWVVKAVNYKLSLFEEKSGYLPKQAYVQLTLALDTKKNLKIEDVKWKSY
jgi:hypothetical protein